MVNFDLFFKRYHDTLIGSSSYVTKRQSIKLLGEILLDRANYSIMTEYVDRGAHLKLCMNLLRDPRKMVQYEGFHVFKVRNASDLVIILSDLSTGLRREPEQIGRSCQDIDTESRSSAQVPPRFSR